MPSWAWGAHESIVFKSCHFMPHFGSSLSSTGNLWTLHIPLDPLDVSSLINVE